MATERPLRPLTAASAPVTTSDTGFSFVVTGDGRPTLPGMPFPAVTREIMREIALLRPAFVLYTGDAIWGYQDTRQEMLNELDRFRALANTTGVPLFNVPGNHELQSSPAALELLTEWGHDLYGSFDIGSYHFVGLNTDEVAREGRITGEQLDWLRSDLSMNRGASGIFVFMHRPLFSWFQGNFNPDDAQVLQGLFRAHPVKAVFAAHDHFYYEEELDGIRYLTLAGAGAPTYTQPQGGGFAHYVLVSVGRDSVDYDVIEPGRLEVTHVAGNDGLEPVSTARVANTTDRDLLLRNLLFRVPRLESADLYRVRADYWDYRRNPEELPVTISDLRDLGDGSVALSVEVRVPTGTAFWVSVEAREPKIG